MRRLLALALLTTAAWTWENPQPLGSTLVAAVEQRGVVHAVGQHGAIARSADDGRTWQVLASPVAADLASVAAAGDLVVAVGSAGTIVRSRSTTAFAARPSPTKQDLIGVAIAGGIVYALARDGAVLRSTDGGDTFGAAGSIGTAVPTAIAAEASGIVVVATTTGLSRSTDRGTTFSVVSAITEPLQRLVAGPVLYALGGHSVTYRSTNICNACIDDHYETLSLYRSTDHGVTWQRRALITPTGGTGGWGSTAVPAPPASAPRSLGMGLHEPPVAMAAWSRRSLVVGPKGEVYAGSDQALFAGATFSRRVGAPLVATQAGTLIDGATARSTNGGIRWSAPPRHDEEVFSIAITPKGRAFAVGMTGTLLARSTTGTWSRLKSPVKDLRLTDIFALDDDHVIAVGDAGTILTSSDGGKTFAVRTSGTQEHLNTVWGAGKTVIVAGSGDARGQIVLRSTDAGATWQRLPGLGSDAGIDLWGSSIDDLYMMTVNGAHLRSTDRGASWKEIGGKFDGVMVGVWGSGPKDVYMIGWGGRLFHTADSGKTWRRLTINTTQDLRAIWGRGPNDVYLAAGGDANGASVLLHSTDRGVTWREEQHPLATPIVSITGDAGTVYVVGGGGRILRN